MSTSLVLIQWAEQIGLGAEPPFQTQIVGVVRDAHQTSLREAPPRMIYTPIAQSDEPPSRFTVAVRVVEQPAPLAAEVRNAVQSLDPDFVIRYMRTMEQQIDASLVRERLLATLSTSFGLLALILAAVGLNGVMAYDVTRRAREIGIRIALGARRGWVLRHVLRGAVIVASAGIAAGIAVALVATRVLATFVSASRRAIRARSWVSASFCSPQRWQRRGYRRGARRASIRCR